MAAETEIERMVVRLIGDVSQYQQSLDQAIRETDKADQAIKSSLSSIGGALQSLGAGITTVGAMIAGVGAGLTAAVTLPLVGIGYQAYNAAVSMDSLKRGLTAVAGSSGEAEKQLVRLREVAKLPGLGLQEAIQGSIRLQAAGFSAELAERSLKGFGNALATVGKGKADLDGVTLALTQIISKGKISAEEINQLSERVPQIRKIMQGAFGTSDSEKLQKMKGLTAEVFVEEIVKELEKLDSVTGGAQNSMENLSDTSFIALSKLGDVILEFVAPAMDKITNLIVFLTKKFEELSPTAKRVIVVVGAIAASVGPLLVIFGGIVIAIGAVVTGLGTILSLGAPALAALAAAVPVGLALGAALTAAGVALYKFVSRLVATGGLQEIWQRITKAAQEFSVKTQGFLYNLRHNVGEIVSYVQRNWEGLMKDLENLFIIFVRSTSHNLGVVLNTAYRLFTIFLGWLKNRFDYFFSAEFASSIISGVVKALEVFKSYAPLITRAITAAISGQSFTFEKLGAQMAVDLAAGMKDSNPLDAMGKVIKEGLADLHSPIKGFKSSIKDTLDLKFELPSDEVIEDTTKRTDGIKRNFEALEKKAKIKAGVSWERNDAVRKGSDELFKMLEQVQQRARMAMPKQDDEWKPFHGEEPLMEGEAYAEVSRRRAGEAAAGYRMWESTSPSIGDPTQPALSAAILMKIEYHLRELVKIGADDPTEPKIEIKPLGLNSRG